MKTQASPLPAICRGPMSLRSTRPTAERDRQSCGGGARPADRDAEPPTAVAAQRHAEWGNPYLRMVT